MKNVLLLLPDGFEAYEASVFTDVFGFAATGGIEISLDSVGSSKQVPCAYGFDVIPNLTFEKLALDKYDALALPGGRRECGFYDSAYSEQFSSIIKHFIKNNKYIATICVGILPVAKTGLLRNYKATTYKGKRRKELTEFSVDVIDTDIVYDKKILSCSAPAYGLEIAFRLLELLTNKKECEKTKGWFGL